jgi:acetyl-CoA C-acetyltransferase
MSRTEIWLAAGLRTPFAKVDGVFKGQDALSLSVPVVRAMAGQLRSSQPDFMVWGAVIPSLMWSNLAREVAIDSGLDPSVPAFSTVMACSTSMVGAFEAAGMIDGTARNLALVGGVESMSRVQVGLTQTLSDWLRAFNAAKTLPETFERLAQLPLKNPFWIPKVVNRTSGLSMGEHTEITAREWEIGREEQDRLALASHRGAVKGWQDGFFDSLVIEAFGVSRDDIPRPDTSLEKLARLKPAFDRTSGKGTLTAGNSSPLTDGAAGVWVGSQAGMARLPDLPKALLVDFEIAAVDFMKEGLLMAPAFAVPRLLARHGLTYADIEVWEIHEAFTAQVGFHTKAWESRDFLKARAGVEADLGPFPRERMNPHGGSTALGHPFGATGARILSQAVKELSLRPKGARAIVSICADGGLGTVALLQN